jgi:hypothetical protein
MFQVDDPYGNIIFTFLHEIILDRSDNVLGFVRDGVVCDKDGTPTRCSVVGTDIMFLAPGTGQETIALSVDGTNIIDSGTVGAVVVDAKSQAEIMLGAAAYWEFVWSLT